MFRRLREISVAGEADWITEAIDAAGSDDERAMRSRIAEVEWLWRVDEDVGRERDRLASGLTGETVTQWSAVPDR